MEGNDFQPSVNFFGRLLTNGMRDSQAMKQSDDFLSELRSGGHCRAASHAPQTEAVTHIFPAKSLVKHASPLKAEAKIIKKLRFLWIQQTSA